jgi:hypothetical protein
MSSCYYLDALKSKIESLWAEICVLSLNLLKETIENLGAGGSGNGAGGGEMEYDGRVAGIGASAGKEGDMGRSGQIGGGGKRGVLM